MFIPHFCSRKFLRIGLMLALSTSLSGCPLMLLPTDSWDLGVPDGPLPSVRPTPRSTPRPSALPGTIPDSRPTQNIDPANIPVLTPGSGSLAESEDLRELTAEFSLNFAPDSPSLIQGIQLKRQDLPENIRLSDLVLERWRTETGSWEREGFPLDWHESSSTVYFEIQNPDYPTGLRTQQLSRAQRFRVRVYIFSNEVSVRREGSAFRIHYYPTRLRYRDSILSDSSWSGSGQADDPGIPDFVEDVDKALSQAYTGLLALRTRTGQPLFRRPTEPIEVYLRDLGGDAGNAPLGGPITLSSHLIKSWEDLQQTATHELVHVLQRPFYTMGGLFTGRANRWFIEAVAQYYTARVLKLSEADKPSLYGDMISDYLGVSLNSSSEGSLYAAGHFLDWASAQISDTLVADALANSSANDMVSLANQIRDQSSYTGLSEALMEYVSWVNSHPQRDGGFNGTIKGTLKGYHSGRQTWPKTNLVFTNQDTYFNLRTQIPSVAFVYGDFYARNDGDALFVMDAADTPSASDLRSRTFDHLDGRAPAGKESKPLEGILDLFGRKQLTIAYFGRNSTRQSAEQWLLNGSMTRAEPVNIHYYLLRTPEVTEQLDGKVTWSTAAAKAIPATLLKGYSVYLDNHLIQDNIPVNTSEVTQSFESPLIKASGLPIKVVITDRHGHSWPEVEAEQIAFELLNNPFPSGMAVMAPGSSVTFEYRVTGVKNPEVRWSLSTMMGEGAEELASLSTAPGKVTVTAGSEGAGVVNLVGTLVENQTMVFMQMISIIPNLTIIDSEGSQDMFSR